MPTPRAPRDTASDPDFMLSLARGLDVIRSFDSNDAALPVAEIARRTHISRAAARRCLYTLERLGYAASSNGTYELSPKVLTLGSAYLGSAKVARVAQHVLDPLSERLQESCSVSVLDGSEIVYVARAAVRRIISIGLFVGTRLPAYCTSMGRVMLAYGPEERLETYLAHVKLVAFTPRTITTASALRTELGRVRTNGYALVDQELEIGLRSVAVPIWGRNRMVLAAINLGVQASRAEPKVMVRDYVPVLKRASKEISASLGYADI